MTYIKMDCCDKYIGGELLPGSSGAGITSINGDANTSQIISGSGGITVTTASGTTTINGASIGGILPVASGGTGLGVLVTAPTASTIPSWDANANLQADNFISGMTITPTAAGTTTLLVGSNFSQYFIGTLGQTVTLPDAATIVPGLQYSIQYPGTAGAITVNLFGGVALGATLPFRTGALYTYIGSDNTSNSWTIIYNGMQVSGAVGALKMIVGGTGQTGSGSSGQFLRNSGGGASAWSSSLSMANSGTGQTSTGTAGQVLTTNGTNVTFVTLVPIASGGTNSATVVNTPTASSWAGWGPNSNMRANNFAPACTVVNTSAITTTLTIASTGLYVYQGTTAGQVVVLPITSTLLVGYQYQIKNTSTQTIDVQSSGFNSIIILAPNTSATLTCVLITGTSAASWTYV
jgi:hypothetical protein